MKALLSHNRLLDTILIALIFSISSCSDQSDSAEQYSEPVLTHTLKKVEEFEIEVDSVTAPNFMHYQYYQGEAGDFFTFLNPIDQHILFYDLNTKMLERKIALNFQGPESVGALQGLYSGYHIHNLDSIFVLNRNTGKLYIVNEQSVVVSSLNFVDDKANPTSLLGPFARPLIKGNEIYLMNNTGSIDPHKRNRSYGSDFASVINLKSADSKDFMTFPAAYTKGIWGDFLHRKSWAIDASKEKIVVSYPIDPKLYEYNLDGELVNTHMAANPYFKKPSSMSRKQRSDRTGQSKYFLAQDRYSLIYYNPFDEVYLRDSQAGIDLDKPGPRKRKSFRRLMILDANLKKIGEYELQTFERLKLFFTEQGIHRITEPTEEDIIKIERYELVEIN